MFKIPKFNFGGGSTTSTPSFGVPAANVNPVPELKLLDIGSGPKPRIDLLAALSKNASLSLTGREYLSQSFPRAPCIVFLERRATVSHSVTAKHLKKGSQFGRILATNYKCRSSPVAPTPPKALVNKHLKAFDFSTASPDDIKIQFFQS